MPPELTQYRHSLVTPTAPHLSGISRKSRYNHHHRRMKFGKMKLIPILVFILSGASLFRFLNLGMITNFSVSLPLPLIYQHECSSSSSLCSKNVTSSSYSQDNSTLTEKETEFISRLLSQKVPCNILIFGNAHQYSTIALLNAGGFTMFVEDSLDDNTSMTNSFNNTRVHKVKYKTTASEAYQMLRDARENPECWPRPRVSKCNLIVSQLSHEVYDTRWDVVVVDGPSGDTPESPGRMGSIYMAGILARRGDMTHVVVHDVDRMIEKWFSWEFLCEENLVSSKGRFWHFQIVQVNNATTFCTP